MAVKNYTTLAVVVKVVKRFEVHFCIMQYVSALHECITSVDQGLNYDTGSYACMKLMIGLTNLSSNSSMTHISLSNLN